jgi:hypothetical protein
VASSLNNFLSVRRLLHFRERHNHNVRMYLDMLRIAAAGKYLLTLSLKRVCRILPSLDCGILHVELLDVLVSFDCEQKPLGLLSPVVFSCKIFLYKCKKLQWSTYKTFNCTFMPTVPYRFPPEINFAL